MDKNLFFDFGGTLDTKGIHWGIYMMSFYIKFGFYLSKDMFREAHIYAERNIPELIKSDTNYYDTLKIKFTYQNYFLKNEYLIDISENKLNKIIDDCYSEVVLTIQENKKILSELQKNYKLSVISNYYGNLKYILKEFEIDGYFEKIFDSTEIGIRKPSIELYQKVVDEMKLEPENCIMIGDSYTNDIVPAKKCGFTTVWFKNKLWSEPKEHKSADFIIKDLNEILENKI